MHHPVFRAYEKLVLRHPWPWLGLLLLVTLTSLWHIRDLRLDASADSLVLQDDKALAYYREVAKRYGGSDFLIIAYSPDNDLFTRDSLAHLDSLRDELATVDGVASVYSMLDVPLLFSPPVAFSDLASGYRTLRHDEVDLADAREEFLEENPLYKDMLVSPDAGTTALLISFERDERYFELLYARNDLATLASEGELNDQQQQEYHQAQRAFDDYKEKLKQENAARISTVRSIMDGYRDQATLFLGGVPMITTDMISFIRSDLRTFGVGVLAFIILTLLVIFRQPRWAVLSVLCCGVATLWLSGWLGWVSWQVSVISSNYVSLLLIITMSITIHLIVRYRELHEENPDKDQRWLVRETTWHMMQPSFFMIVTTMVGFSSLVYSGIKPVMDFGWMMTIGIGLALVICYLVFPAFLSPLKAPPVVAGHDFTRAFTTAVGRFTRDHTRLVLVLASVLLLVSVAGMLRLTVENRFIDYFQDDTEIYQGMRLIDRKLGGTTPLDIVIDAPADYQPTDDFGGGEDPFADPFDAPADDGFDDPFADPFADDTSDVPDNPLEDAYWFTPQRLATLTAIEEWLSAQPETGKVLSLATTYRVAKKLNGGDLSYMQLMLLGSFIPADLRSQMVKPYLSDDGNQVRITVRMIDSDPNLKRDEFIHRVRTALQSEFGLAPEQVHLTGAMVLYNNMLQSLFDSQIKTLGLVFLAILVMLALLFRRLPVALIALGPSIVSASLVLGLMGWIGLPLDLMTITIAAITVGIAVDDTIHYVHRFREELPRDNDYVAAMLRCHGSIGKAMFYTSITIIAGFSILTLSSFNPTVYFGVLTGVAMAMALLCNLTLLPASLVFFKPKMAALD
ncbi:MAG: MMPL family transporter [Alcanivoracaceae bacterium]|nr:MMPL family transporter [Alcanivoracaceae bacterium]